MTRIRILPETLASQIAAGEVVQRPASIVKELVENSLDAEASSVWIALQHGGKTSILVRDDGLGMEEEDALLSFERHATSKIAEIHDLMALHSFGFRGEALPSIASISHVRLITAIRDGEGTEILVEGGKIRNVKPIGCPRGTEIQIRRLFFNTPARRKFLKSTFTEYNHCLTIITRFAIIHPLVAWHLEHDGKTVHHIPVAESMKQRIGQVFGESYLQSMISFEGEKDGIRLSGLLGNLFLSRSDRSQQYFYVNHRPVYNMTMRNALTSVTKNVLPKGKFPVIFISVECDPEQVDVNVHPAKTEVKFRHEWTVYELLVEVLSRVLSQHVPKTTPRFSYQAPQPAQAGESPTVPASVPMRGDLAGETTPPPETTADSADVSIATTVSTKPDMEPDVSQQSHVAGPVAPWQNNKEFFDSLGYIGQVFQSFLIFETASEMVMIDQHAAHERVLFEKIRDKLDQRAIPIQHLLVPETLDFSPSEFLFVQKHAELLEHIGFGLDQFGSNTYMIRSIPAWLGHRDPRPVFLEIIDEIKDRISLNKSVTIDARQELAKILACKSAIKIHRHITSVEATDLIRQLSLTAVPFTCPHGRPIIVTFTFRDLERFFKR